MYSSLFFISEDQSSFSASAKSLCCIRCPEDFSQHVQVIKVGLFWPNGVDHLIQCLAARSELKKVWSACKEDCEHIRVGHTGCVSLEINAPPYTTLTVRIS